MITRLPIRTLSLLLVAIGTTQAQEAPTVAPPNFTARSPSVGFVSPSIGYSSPRIEFRSPPMTQEELALGPRPKAPPSPIVKGLEVTEVEGGVRYTLSADILFDFDKATLRPKATQALQAMSNDVRQRFKEASFVVDGYTDSKGSDAYNLKLSLRRAAAVKNYLATAAKFNPSTVAIEGRGEANPVALNETPDGQDDPDGRQKNRRVEILVRATD